jgi:serine protease Do
MNIKIIPATLFCLFSLFGFTLAEGAGLVPGRSALSQTPDSFTQIVENAQPAVVYIQVKNKIEPASTAAKESFYNDPAIKDIFSDKDSSPQGITFFEDTNTFGSGSGFIFNSDGYILTNYHVLAKAVEVTVTMADKTKHTAKIVGTDKATDVGLLKIDGKDLPALPLGDSDILKAGEWVLAFGSTFEFIQTVTAGIISATGRNNMGISDYESFIQTDAAINPGNSGGPLVNIHGQVIGINTAFLTQTGGYIGIGFAIPANIARKVSEQLLKDRKVTRAWLGVALKDVTVKLLKKQGIPTTIQAAYIVRVEENSPAELAGLQSGDIVTAINNVPVAGAADLRNRISLSAPETEVLIEYYRKSVKNLARATLGTLH